MGNNNYCCCCQCTTPPPAPRLQGGSGEKDRTGVSHESFLLMASSQSDMEDWVRAIRRAIWAPLGGGVFGQHLEETMLCEAQCGPERLVPVLVEQCVCFIRQRGLEEEGLFRAPGQTNHVRELQDSFDRGEKPVFDSTTDVHTVASLLKLYIRELPEPIIPFCKYTQFLSCAQLLTKDKEMGIVELGKQVKSLSQVNYNLLKYICKFLDEVQSHSGENKMSVQNLATVFGPNILRPRVDDPVTMMEGTSQVQHLMTVMISEHIRLYQREEPAPETQTPPPTSRSPTQRAQAEWVSQDESDLQPAAPPSSGSDAAPKLDPGSPLAGSDLSLDARPSEATPPGTAEKAGEERSSRAKAEGRMDGRSEGKVGGSEVALSPSKQSKALPSWRCSLKGGAVSAGAKGKLGGSAGDVSVAAGGNWLMNGLSSLRVHRRTASSGERLKDSTLSLKESTLSLKESSLKDSKKDPLDDASSSAHSPVNSSSLSHRSSVQSHRLSAYDNVAPSCLSLPADTSSLWTSFEISLDGSGGDEPGRPGSGLGGGRDGESPSEARDSGSSEALDRCVSSAGCSEAEPADDARGPVSGMNEGLTHLVSELKQEMKRQRSSCESSIRKLEDSCSKYHLEVTRLEEELDQEKKRFHMLEIRLRNSERAREDAENRNVLLQKEMEEFFKTLGDLTTGAGRTN